MTAVTISGTFGKNERPSNGLEEIADQLIKDQLGRHFVVGVVQFAGASVPGPNEPLVPRVKFLAIEPLESGSLAAKDAERILDGARKHRGLGQLEDTVASDPVAFEFDEDGKVSATWKDGEPETRLGADGEHQVPEASAEELQAEREEQAAAGVPAPEFSGGAE
jgi:hypothetical protein